MWSEGAEGGRFFDSFFEAIAAALPAHPSSFHEKLNIAIFKKKKIPFKHPDLNGTKERLKNSWVADWKPGSDWHYTHI